ncbi:MAG: hypothetical protein ACRD1V_13860, partial [Vicinamibacterales bacterium]
MSTLLGLALCLPAASAGAAVPQTAVKSTTHHTVAAKKKTAYSARAANARRASLARARASARAREQARLRSLAQLR